jgi:hypothetical protein
LQNIYEYKKDIWSAKGKRKILEEFFNELNRWFYLYYDTEIFKINILDFIEDDENNYEQFMDIIEIVLGFGKWQKTFGMGLTFYNFRQIDEDIFGKSYEMFLAENRKEGGIYYTSKEITTYMAKEIVNELFVKRKENILKALEDNDFERAEKEIDEMIKITILDPACGSGSFLIKVLREIYKVYEEIDDQTFPWEKQSQLLDIDPFMRKRRENIRKMRRKLGFSESTKEKRKLISLIILRHLYGIDIDEGAVEIAKVNLWKEAIKLHPNSFYYRNLTREHHILPDLELNIINGNSLYSLDDDKITKVIEQNEEFRQNIRNMLSIRNEYLSNPFNPDILAEFKERKEKLKGYFWGILRKRYGITGILDKPVFYPIEFPHIYFDNNGKILEGEKGFDGIIGNPPWENLKPIKKEFASHYPVFFGEITKFSIKGKEFKRFFEERLKIEEIRELWEEYQEEIRKISNYLKGNYRLRGRGDISYQKLFIELALKLSKKVFILLVPSNFHTDEGAKELREEILKNYNLKELLSFENRRHMWFKDVDPRYKFDIVFMEKKKPEKTFKARFYVRNWEEIGKKFDYKIELITKISPRSKTVTEFLDPCHIPLMENIRGDHPLLYELGIKLVSEFHMTNDNYLFHTKKKEDYLPLYEGKMIYQYDSHYSDAYYFVKEKDGRERLIERKLNGEIKRLIKKLSDSLGLKRKEAREFKEKLMKKCFHRFESGKWKLDYEVERLAYRAVASSTNERTLIGVVIPEKGFAGHSLNLLKQFYYEIDIESEEILQLSLEEKIGFDFNYYFQALINSFVLDYYIRQRVSANLTMFFLEELPIPDSPEREEVIDLSYSIQRLVEQGDEEEALLLRAELEAKIARDLFSLDKTDMKKILDTFIYGNIDKELIDLILEKI